MTARAPRHTSKPPEGIGYVIKPMLMTMKQTLKSTFGRSSTVVYPYERIEYPSTSRGEIRLIKERCISCSQCERICPNQTIWLIPVEGTKKGMPKVNFARCMFCALCEEVCPTDALILTNHFEMATGCWEEMNYSFGRMLIEPNDQHLLHKEADFPRTIISKAAEKAQKAAEKAAKKAAIEAKTATKTSPQAAAEQAAGELAPPPQTEGAPPAPANG